MTPSIQNDPFNLKRFINAQEGAYSQVVVELRSGRKRTHWMWFIFPQISGLGHSEISKRFAIRTLEEAQHYLNHPILGKRLNECTEAVLGLSGKTVTDMFGYPDDMKFRSSMTLFALASEDKDNLFVEALNEYFNGNCDTKTVKIIEGLG